MDEEGAVDDAAASAPIDERWLAAVEKKLDWLERDGEWRIAESAPTLPDAARALLAEVRRLRREKRQAERWAAILVKRAGGTVDLRKHDLISLRADDTVASEAPAAFDREIVARLRYVPGDAP